MSENSITSDQAARRRLAGAAEEILDLSGGKSRVSFRVPTLRLTAGRQNPIPHTVDIHEFEADKFAIGYTDEQEGRVARSVMATRAVAVDTEVHRPLPENSVRVVAHDLETQAANMVVRGVFDALTPLVAAWANNDLPEPTAAPQDDILERVFF